MDGVITVECKVVGRRRPLFADWSVPLPPGVSDGGGHITLRDLISQVVREEVASFRQRQDERRLVKVLTARQIEEGAAKGKVDSGGRDLDQEVDEECAVGAALQAFEDGIYLVVLDGDEQRELDRQVFVRPDTRMSFIRLTLLAGG